VVSLINKLNKKEISVIIAFSLAVGLRVLFLSNVPRVHFDELEILNLINNTILKGEVLTHGVSSYIGPSYYYLSSFFFLIFGSSVLILRIINALFGVATVILVYNVIKLFLSEKQALFGSLLLATHPFHVFYTRIGWEFGALPFFTTVFLYFIIKLQHARKIQEIILFSLLSWISLSIGIGWHSIFVPMFICGSIFLIITIFKKLDFARSLFLSVLFCFIFIAINNLWFSFYFPMFKNLIINLLVKHSQQPAVPLINAILIFWKDFLGIFSMYYTFLRFSGIGVISPFAVMFLFSFTKVFQDFLKNKTLSINSFLVFVTLFFFLINPLIIVSISKHVFSIRYFLILVPFDILIILYSLAPHKRYGELLIYIMFILHLILIIFFYFIPFQFNWLEPVHFNLGNFAETNSHFIY